MTIWFQYSGHKREPNRTPIDYLSQRIVFDNSLSAIMAEVPCGLCNKHCDEDTASYEMCVYDFFPFSCMVRC